jgi:hypothetical protein
MSDTWLLASLFFVVWMLGFAYGWAYHRSGEELRQTQRELDEQADRLGHPEWKSS